MPKPFNPSDLTHMLRSKRLLAPEASFAQVSIESVFRDKEPYTKTVRLTHDCFEFRGSVTNLEEVSLFGTPNVLDEIVGLAPHGLDLPFGTLVIDKDVKFVTPTESIPFDMLSTSTQNLIFLSCVAATEVSVLFWDMPAFDPVMYNLVIEKLKEIPQVILTTHSYAFLQSLELIGGATFHTLHLKDGVVCSSFDKYIDVVPNHISTAYTHLYDAVIERDLSLDKESRNVTTHIDK